MRQVGFMKNAMTKRNKVIKKREVLKKGNQRFFFELRQEKLWLGRHYKNVLSIENWNIQKGNWGTAKDGRKKGVFVMFK